MIAVVKNIAVGTDTDSINFAPGMEKYINKKIEVKKINKYYGRDTPHWWYGADYYWHSSWLNFNDGKPIVINEDGTIGQ